MDNNQSKPAVSYKDVVELVKSNFEEEILMFGTEFMILRPISIIDILFQKRVEVENTSEAIIKQALFSIIQYSAVGHIRLGMDNEDSKRLKKDEAISLYEKVLTSATKLMVHSNYPETLESSKFEIFSEELVSKITDLRKKTRNADFKNKEVGEEFLDIINLSIFSLMILEN